MSPYFDPDYFDAAFFAAEGGEAPAVGQPTPGFARRRRILPPPDDFHVVGIDDDFLMVL
jgi:hypothetical protein